MILLGTGPRRFAVLLTVALALVGAAASAVQGAADFASVSQLVQASVSISLPFLAAGVAHGTWRPRPGLPRTTPGGAVVLTGATALVAGLAGNAFAVATVLLAGLPWGGHVVGTAGAALAVQLLANLVGCGFGFLVPRAWMAGLLTVVVPLGCYALLAGTSARSWLTPFAGAQALLDGDPSLADAVRELVILAVWGAGLNLLGLVLLRRRRRRGPAG